LGSGGRQYDRIKNALKAESIACFVSEKTQVSALILKWEKPTLQRKVAKRHKLITAKDNRRSQITAAIV
jgi:hypothetical protein